jgi:perosamine synthetase
MSKVYPWWTTEFGKKERVLIDEVFASNFINDGDLTTRFENDLAARVGSTYAVATSSGTAALFLALAALDIDYGDEVIVPDVTFIATANAVTLAGATPVLVDVDQRTLNIDPRAAERAITPHTKAIMPVHVSGRGADMPALLELGKRHNISVIEDAAESLASRRFGKTLGAFGVAGCVSFSPNKHITTGQGGMVFTNSEELQVRLRELKDQGRSMRGTGGDDSHPRVGYNFKLTNVQAAIGLGQLDFLDARAKRLRDHYRIYRDQLADLSQVELPGFAIEEGETPQWVDAIFHERRNELEKFLAARQMGCRRFWHPIHTQPPYQQPDARFPNSSRLMPKALWLPSAFTLTDSDIIDVCTAIREFFGRKYA